MLFIHVYINIEGMKDETEKNHFARLARRDRDDRNNYQ